MLEGVLLNKIEKMRYLVFNWKMNPASLQTSKELIDLIEHKSAGLKGIKTIVAPPLIYLSSLAEYKQNHKMKNFILAGQNMFWLGRGAFTGETSPLMLKYLKVPLVIIGHSERRLIFQETNEIINKKIKEALARGLKVILCVGEKHKRQGGYRKQVFSEMNYALRGVDKREGNNIIIAYEPIWAIGTGYPPSTSLVEETASYIKQWLAVRFSEKQSKKIPVLYGGSIQGKNILDYWHLKNIRGVLIGGASTKKIELNSIFKQLSS